MANNYRDIDKDQLMQLAIDYCEDCIAHTKTHVAGSGKVVLVEDRKLPTIGCFPVTIFNNRSISFIVSDKGWLGSFFAV